MMMNKAAIYTLIVLCYCIKSACFASAQKNLTSYGLYTEVNRYDDLVYGIYSSFDSAPNHSSVRVHFKAAIKYAAGVTEEVIECDDVQNCSDSESYFISLDGYLGLSKYWNQWYIKGELGLDLGELVGEMISNAIFGKDDDEPQDQNMDYFMSVGGGFDYGNTRIHLFTKFNSFNGFFLNKHQEVYYGLGVEFFY